MVVIELDRNINFEFEIFPICLPKIATVGRDSRKGQIATVTGTVYTYIRTVSSQRLLSTLLIQFKLVYGLPYARHYNPQFVYFLPHFSVQFIIKSG